MFIVLTTNSPDGFPDDTKAYASHHGASFESMAMDERGQLCFVDIRETEMDRGEPDSLKKELLRLRAVEAEHDKLLAAIADTEPCRYWEGRYVEERQRGKRYSETMKRFVRRLRTEHREELNRLEETTDDDHKRA